eukprot:4227195-Prymnesium_polylepis.1
MSSNQCRAERHPRRPMAARLSRPDQGACAQHCPRFKIDTVRSLNVKSAPGLSSSTSVSLTAFKILKRTGTCLSRSPTDRLRFLGRGAPKVFQLPPEQLVRDPFAAPHARGGEAHHRAAGLVERHRAEVDARSEQWHVFVVHKHRELRRACARH